MRKSTSGNNFGATIRIDGEGYKLRVVAKASSKSIELALCFHNQDLRTFTSTSRATDTSPTELRSIGAIERNQTS